MRMRCRIVAVVAIAILLQYAAQAFEIPLPPVLLVPGVGGSKLYDASGEKIWVVYSRAGYGTRCIANPECRIQTGWRNYGLWEVDQLDPELLVGASDSNYYKVLIDNLKSYGYVPGKNLFAFPYEWRTGLTNPEVMRGLHYLVSRIRPVVIAHSMGGLLMQAYDRAYPQNNIRKIINIGVPFQGAGGNALGAFVDGYDLGNTIVSGYKDDLRNVALKFTSAYHLLPSTQYLNSFGISVPRIRGADYLDALSNLTGFNRTYYDSIRIRYSRYTDITTLSYFITLNSTGTRTYWDYGGVARITAGDGTVPLFSQTPVGTPSEKKIELSGIADHVSVLHTTGLANQVMGILGNCDFTGTFCERNKPNCVCLKPTLERWLYNITNCYGYVVAGSFTWFDCRRITVNNIEYVRDIGSQCSGHAIYSSRYARGYYYYSHCHYGRFTDRVYRVCYRNETHYDPVLERCGNTTSLGIDPKNLDISDSEMRKFAQTYVDPQLPMIVERIVNNVTVYVNVTEKVAVPSSEYEDMVAEFRKEQAAATAWRIATTVLASVLGVLIVALAVLVVRYRAKLIENILYSRVATLQTDDPEDSGL